MAKQIKPEEEISIAREPEVINPETKAQVEAGTKVKDAAKTEAKPDGYVLSVLQAFPNYELLYLDKQGGIYTPDTPENLREMATLYKNPYFIQP